MKYIHLAWYYIFDWLWFRDWVAYDGIVSHYWHYLYHVNYVRYEEWFAERA